MPGGLSIPIAAKSSPNHTKLPLNFSRKDTLCSFSPWLQLLVPSNPKLSQTLAIFNSAGIFPWSPDRSAKHRQVKTEMLQSSWRSEICCSSARCRTSLVPAAAVEAIVYYAYEETCKRLMISYHNDTKHAPLSPWINYPTGNRCQLSWWRHFTKTDGCLVSPVSIHYHEELTFIWSPPPPLQICNSVADLQFNGTEKSEAESPLQAKVILNPGLLHSLWAALLQMSLLPEQWCHTAVQPLPSRVRFRHVRDLLFFAEVLRTAFGTTQAAGIFVSTSPDKPLLSFNCFPNSH